MANSYAALKATLDILSRATWVDMEEGRRLGVGMGEVGITDRNALALRREHPALLIHKHSAYEEVRTGADWEWWLRTADGWMCFVFQAKVLNANGRYPGITKSRPDGKAQIDLLLHGCLRRSERLNGTVWPLYCFYNSWSGGWPDGVRRYDGAYPYVPSDEELQLYGCAAANAWSVQHVLTDRAYSSRRTLRNSYLPVSRPWSRIFPDPAVPTTSSPSQAMIELSSWMPGRRQLPPPTPSIFPPDDMGDESGGGRRDRMAIYHDPALIGRPPDYVLDLLEGSVQARRLKPLARRVVILPELT